MKKNFMFFIMAVFIFNSISALAQPGGQPDASSGLEAKKVEKGVTVLMPKGAQMSQRNKSTYVEESSDSYAARNFVAINNRLNRLERENMEVRQEIDAIKSMLGTAEPDANQ